MLTFNMFYVGGMGAADYASGASQSLVNLPVDIDRATTPRRSIGAKPRGYQRYFLAYKASNGANSRSPYGVLLSTHMVSWGPDLSTQSVEEPWP